MERIFQTFRKLGVVVLVIAGLIQVYDWVSRRSPDITVSVSEYPINHPTSFHEFFELINDSSLLLEAARLRRAAEAADDMPDLDNGDSENWPGQDAIDLVKEIQNRIPRGFPGSSRLGDFSRLTSITIINQGSAKATGLVLQLPVYSHVEIRRANGRYYVVPRETKSRVELGELLSGESILIRAWTAEQMSAYGAGKSSEIVLHHDDGVVKAKVFEMVSPFWAWLADAWKLLIFVPLGLYIAIQLTYWETAEDVRQSKVLRDLRERVAAIEAQELPTSEEPTGKHPP